MERGAELGSGCQIGPGAVIGRESRLGERVIVGANVVLSGKIEIGNDVRIWPTAVLGEEPQDRAYDGAPSRVRIGGGCQIREFVTIHRGNGEGTETTIEPDVLLMANCHVGHNCRVRERAIVASGALLAGYVDLGRNAFVSGNSVIHQFARVGTLAMIGGGSRVNRDVPPFALLVGDSKLRSLNRVGLGRAGFEGEVLSELSELYRILRRASPLLTNAVPDLRERSRSAQGKELVEFLAGPSERGFCRF